MFLNEVIVGGESGPMALSTDISHLTLNNMQRIF